MISRSSRTPRERQPEYLLVDGYNLLKAAPLGAREEQLNLKAARQHLEQTLIRYARRVGAHIALFFDGSEEEDLLPSPQRPKEIEVFFSRPPEKADDLIKRAIQERRGARCARLISSDRELCRWARRHKIRSTSSAEFLEELERPRQLLAISPPATPRELDPDLVLDQDEIDAWEDLFARGREEGP